MDVSFKTPQGRFNWRVAAVILHQDRLLVMRDCDSPILYLPGGRVTMGETALDALHRELLEELHLPIEVERPLWFHENFFRLAQTGEPFHELGLYYRNLPGEFPIWRGHLLLPGQRRRRASVLLDAAFAAAAKPADAGLFASAGSFSAGFAGDDCHQRQQFVIK